MMRARWIRKISTLTVAVSVTLTLSADAFGAAAHSTDETTAALVAADEPYTEWTGTLEEAEEIVDELDTSGQVLVILADLGATQIAGVHQQRAAAVFWASPRVIVISEDWLNSLSGPGGREFFRSVLLHEHTHAMAMIDLSAGGALPKDLILTEADRSWAGGAMAGEVTEVSAALEAIAACVQAAEYDADPSPLSNLLNESTLPTWLADGEGTYLSSPYGCPPAYTDAAMSYLDGLAVASS